MPNTPGNVRCLYTLTRRGRRVLQDQGVEVAGWYRPEKASHLSLAFYNTTWQSQRFLLHYISLSANTLRTSFGDAHLVYHGADPPRFTRPTVGGEITITLIPDLFVSIERTDNDPSKSHDFGLWFEVDRGTESKAKFKQLVLNRIDLIR